jgi:hypothetical protein
VGRGFQGIAITRDGALIDSETKAVSARFQQQSTRSVNQTLTRGFAQGRGYTDVVDADLSK